MTTETITTGVATPIETPSELLTVIQQGNLEPATAQGLLDSYRPLFIEANTLLAKAKGAAEAVTDPTRLTEIEVAKRLRLDLAKVRVRGDKLRESLKQDSLRRANAIQGVFNVLKYMVEPVEEALKNAEQIAERAEAARKAALKSERESLLLPYGIDVSFYALAEMPETAFNQLLDSTKASHEAKIEEAKRAEENRIAKEKADSEERERQRQENERLKREAAEKEAELDKERARVAKEKADEAAAAKAEIDRIEAVAAQELKIALDKAVKAAEEAMEEKARIERENIEAKLALEKAALESKANEERIAREKLEAEKEASLKSEQDRIAAEKEAARKAAAAPDKEKLLAFAEAIRSVPIPALFTEEGNAIIATIKSSQDKFVNWVIDKANTI